MTRPIDIVRKLCPKAKPSYAAAFEAGDALFASHGINTPLRLAHFLAQAFHETGGLSIEWESGQYSAARLLQVFGGDHHSAALTPKEAERLAYKPEAIFERVYGPGNPKKAHELGNTQPGDGYRYRGGGILQTTGRANYRRMGQKCGVDFEAHPDLVLSAAHALKPALIEWSEGNLNAAADRDDLRTITRRINGGYNGLAERADWFRKIRPLIDNVDLKPSPPPPSSPPDIDPPPPVSAPKSQPVARPVAAVAGIGAAGAVAAAQQSQPGGVSLAMILAVTLTAAVLAAFGYWFWHKERKS